MKLSVILLILFSCQLTQAEFPLLDEPSRKFKQGYWNFSTQVNYFQATANYSKDGGQFSSLAAGYSYRLITTDIGAHYGMNPKTNAYFSTQIANAESKDLTTTRTNSSLTQGVFGFDHLYKQTDSYEFIPDIFLILPAQRVDPNKDEVNNSEGAIELTTRLIVRAHWKALHPFAFAGFTYRDEDRSNLLPYGAGAEIAMGSNLLGGEVRGYQTVTNDKYYNDTNKRQAAAVHNGGSLKFYSVDQSLLETNFWLRTQGKTDWNWKFGGGTTITGASSAAGWNVFAGISIGIDGANANLDRPSSLRIRPQKPLDEVDRFQEETTDGVNQHYFKKPAPQPPKQAPKPSSKTKTNTTQQNSNIQSELDQTEFQIELKKKKKKKLTN